MSALMSRALKWHRPLMIFTLAMVVLAVATTIGLFVDDRQLDGAPIWAKPLKFSVSLAVYAFTWGWLFSLSTRARRTRWWLGTVLAAAGVIEIAIIVFQAAQGHRSHFNVSSPLDITLFSIMGTTIAVLMLANILSAVLVLAVRQADDVTTWALRIGLVVSAVGIGFGALMLGPTPAQSQGLIEGAIGAHTVGLPDGGPGLPILGWSTVGGDLRVPHFVGMHALQFLPLFAMMLLALAGRLPALADETVRVRLVLIMGGAYAAFVALVTWQALRGQSFVRPDGATLAILALIVIAAAAASATALRQGKVGLTRSKVSV
ncbi:hypothetical protein [Sinosporangium siamense]|uniref:Uncharacterized protein n=1 Tax=Sinosporangium siamense TaxID=1367973 RepID=A0A919V2W7_9ACTN|nr:hypothetical protein [Sinosporangium siamense]GII90360.1 hypothetical protein Ssi02_05910 [Sinosporangium siamense]